MSIPLVALREMVRDRIGVPQHDDYFSPSVLNNNINLALAAIESEERWPWNERVETLTLDADSKATLPANWRTTRAVIHGQQDLQEWTYYDLITRFGEANGAPSHYAIVDSTMHVRPLVAAGTQITHLYYEEPTVLSGDEDVPSLPKQHINVLVAKAAQLCSVREDDRPSAQEHLAEYLQGITRMKKDVRGTSRPVTIRVRPGNWV